MPGPVFPVSVKAVLPVDGRVPLLLNERGEWELPGGRLEPGEQPADAVIREIHEELGVAAAVDRLLDTWLYRIAGHGEVLIVTYLCRLTGPPHWRVSDEHRALRHAALSELDALPMPEGYRRSVRAVLAAAPDSPEGDQNGGDLRSR